MKIGKKRREFLAANLADIAKYAISIVILGQLALRNIDAALVSYAGSASIIMLTLAFLVTPEEVE